jgi:hypothetical protein
MLEGLDAINWEQLTHAYGEATNVPEMLRGLASPDRDERENALDGLFWSIHHQGTIYEATAPAVPFLLELAGSPEVRDRDRIVDLLAAIAGGCGYYQVHQVFDSPERRASTEFQETLAEERSCQQAVREAVWRGLPLFLDLLRSDEPALRHQALKVVQRLLDQARPDLAQAVDRLISCLREPDHPEKEGILLRLGEAARFHADPQEAFRASVDHHERDIALSNMDDLREEPEQEGLPAWFELPEEHRHWSEEALRTLWKSWDLFGRLGESPDSATREAAVFLQTMLPRFATPAAPTGLVAAVTPALLSEWARRLETSAPEQEQANLLFALATLAPENPRVAGVLRDTLNARPGRLVGYVAALKIVDLTGDVDDRGLDLLLDVYQDCRAVYDQLLAMPRWEPYWVLPRLQRLGPAVVERRLPTFVDLVRSTGKGPGSSGRARELLRLAFGGKKLPPGVTARDLTAAQRQLLLAAADNGHFWTNLVNDRLELDRLLGLPNDRRRLRAFLALPGEPVSRPRDDPEEALVQFERLVSRQLPFERGRTPYQREEGDTRAPFRQIQESIAEANRIAAAYRPGDRPHIRRLEPRGHACDSLVALLPLCPNLEELDLSYGEATDASLHHLARLPRLERLDLTGNLIGDAGLRHLAALTSLRELGLGQTAVGDTGLRHLSGLVHLRKLNLQGTQVRGCGLAHLHAAGGLEVLWLVTEPLTDEAVLPLGAFRGLRELHVGGGCFTGTGLEAWKDLADLRELWLSGPLVAEGLRGLEGLTNLERLHLGGAGVGDEHARALPALSGLKSLSLARTAVTDAGLEGVERFPVLERLDLSCTRVTDAALPRLLGLRHLQWASLYHTAVSAQAVEELRRAFPKAYFNR